jgi:hypothetical protein
VTTPRAVVTQLHALEHLVPGPKLGIETLDVTGQQRLASAFDADTVAMASAAASNLAAGISSIDRDRVVTSMTGHVELDGEPIPKWADLSGYYRTAGEPDRYLQLHCNFPHHAAGVVELLGCDADRDAVQNAVLTWDPIELEGALVDIGMIAARLRTIDEWDRHPHAAATAHLPLISVEHIGDAPPRPASDRLRVLDCSRVLAGPIAGQTLAANGADVLRIGAPHLPSVQVAVLGTGFGKRNAHVDLDTVDGSRTFADLLTEADVWLDAYRPGAFAARGFDADAVAPGGVVVQISAFDWTGPWANRRGFDSIVQSTTGIVEAGTAAAGSDGPTPLPVQLLDYATGYLASFAARRLIAHQRDVGGTWLARLSLLRTRNWLVSLGGPSPFIPAAPTPMEAAMTTVSSPFGLLTAPLPIGGTFGAPPQPLGSSLATW